MKYRKIEIEESSWSALHNLEEHIPFDLSINSPTGENQVGVNLKGVAIGGFDESMAIPIKAVRHDFMEEDGYRVDTAAVIPFGSEPAIFRKFEYLGNIIKVTTDLRLKAAITGELYSIDELLIRGNWKKSALIKMSPERVIEEKIEWDVLPEKDGVLYDADDLFGILLLESEEGARIEIGAGFDLWRWNIAQQSDTTVQGQLKVELSNGAISLKRNIMISESEFEIPKREWRFKWYMAWDNGDDKVLEPIPKGASLSVCDLDYPESSMVKKGNKKVEYPCLHSKAVRNRLKKWVRSQLGNSDGVMVELSNVVPHICTNSTHLDRAKVDELLHWDLDDIIEFWFWGNRQLRKKESFLSISTEKGGIFEQLPSFKAMIRD